MRILVAMLLIMSVFLDFSASCLAEESLSHETIETSNSKDAESVRATQSCPDHPSSNPKTESHHCHAGHMHAAVKYSTPFPLLPTPLITNLEFLDTSCSIPSPFLAEIIRPPIIA